VGWVGGGGGGGGGVLGRGVCYEAVTLGWELCGTSGRMLDE